MVPAAVDRWQVIDQWVRVGPHEHRCVIFDTDIERQHLLASFVQSGLRFGRRIWCLAEPETTEQVIDELNASGPIADQLRERGQLAVASSRASYSPQWPFDPERLLKWISRAVEDAVHDGFTGCRIAVDLRWAAYPVSEAGCLRQFESDVGELIADLPSAVMSVYDRRVFDGAYDTFDSTRPHVVDLASIYQDGIFRITPTADGMRLAGEVDLSNRDALQRAVTAATHGGADIHLDLTELTFVSIGALRVLDEAARRAHGAGRALILHDLCRWVRRIVGLYWPGELPDGLIIKG
jgi:anti-anti-sigma factor